MTKSAQNDAVITTERVGSPHYFLRICFSDLFVASKYFQEGGASDCACDWGVLRTSSFVFLAFYIEAYINYVLYAGFSDNYESLEREPIKRKIQFILDSYQISDVNLAMIIDLFQFRNDLAHGKFYIFPSKSKKIKAPAGDCFNDDVYADLDKGNRTRWEKFIGRDFEKLLRDVHEILRRIDEASNLPFRLEESADYRPRSYKKM